MPPACPVDRYVPRYSAELRSRRECHRLVRWIVTFLATGPIYAVTWNATGLPGGSLTFPRYSAELRSRRECHRLVRWIVTFLATVPSYAVTWNATGLPGGSLRSLLQCRATQSPAGPAWPGIDLRKLGKPGRPSTEFPRLPIPRPNHARRGPSRSFAINLSLIIRIVYYWQCPGFVTPSPPCRSADPTECFQ